VLLQVQVEELEHEVQLGVGVDDVLEPHDVGVLELFQEGDLPDGRRGHPFLLLLEPDFLEGDRRARCAVAGLVDDAVGALADLLDLLVLEIVLLGFCWFFFCRVFFEFPRIDGGGRGEGAEKEVRREEIEVEGGLLRSSDGASVEIASREVFSPPSFSLFFL
jgi:hypothetical protein